ncbi:MAG TPA: hypothetical protein VN448_07790 [Gammaproteobacteria bacterium]|jgi:hypothetical protein|nr:hypothetical protein [Gammaproteobacteria bacterium]
MVTHIHVPQVGAPDPELNNSPFAEETDEEYEVLRREVPGEPVCYFNNQSYRHDSYVCSGSTLMRCDYGIWVRMGSCDPDNP